MLRLLVTYAQWHKECFTVKPGIAIRYNGGKVLNDFINKNNLVAIPVPADYATRWRARKPVRRFK